MEASTSSNRSIKVSDDENSSHIVVDEPLEFFINDDTSSDEGQFSNPITVRCEFHRHENSLSTTQEKVEENKNKNVIEQQNAVMPQNHLEKIVTNINSAFHEWQILQKNMEKPVEKIDNLKTEREALKKNFETLEAENHELVLAKEELIKRELTLEQNRSQLMKAEETLNTQRELCVTEICDLQKRIRRMEKHHDIMSQHITKSREQLQSISISLVNIITRLSISKDGSSTGNFFNDGDSVASSVKLRKRKSSCDISYVLESHSSDESEETNFQPKYPMLKRNDKDLNKDIEPRMYTHWSDEELKRLISYMDEYKLWSGRKSGWADIFADMKKKNRTYPGRTWNAVKRKISQIINDPEEFEKYKHDREPSL